MSGPAITDTFGPLSQAHVVAFVCITDPARARMFYSEMLGIRFVQEDAFALLFDCGGTMLRAAKVKSVTPAPATVLGWEVEDIHAAVGALAGNGVLFERFPGMLQDDLGIWTAPGGSKVAWFKDPDGNLLSVSERGLPD